MIVWFDQERMSSELYDRFARINRIDQAIFESEQEIANGDEIYKDG